MAWEKLMIGPNADVPVYVDGDASATAAVIVIQEWWGINDLIKSHASAIAQKGFRVLIPDLYNGKIGADKEEASHLLSNLDWAKAIQEVNESVKYLRANGASKVGCIGFCMGGALSLAAGQHCEINCAIPFYGTPSPELSQPENIKAPVEMHFGALDQLSGFSDPATATAFAEKIKAAGGDVTLHIYPNCGHGFLNAGEEGTAKREHMGFPEPSDEDQALAWGRVHAFLEKHLKA